MITADTIIEDALAELNIAGIDENVSAPDQKYCLRKLNRLITKFRNYGLNLWKKKTGTLFLQKDQKNYNISASGDHSTLIYVESTTAADYSTGEDEIIYNDEIARSIDDHIGIQLDDGSLYWSIVTALVGTKGVSISPDSIPSDASEGNIVYIYTDKIANPLNILAVNRKNLDDIEVPLNKDSYQDYFWLPNKESEGIPVSYRYDRQKDNAVISVWPVPTNVDENLRIVYTEKIATLTSIGDTLDFPEEYEDVIVLNLAVQLGIPYSRALGQDYIILKQHAAEALIIAQNFDTESANIYFQPDYMGGYRVTN